MVIFLGRDCHFLRSSWLFQNLGRDGNFLGRDCHFFRTSWQFHNLGRVGHILRTRWSPFNEFGKLQILGNAFCNYWGMVKLLGGGGDIYPPSPPASAPLIPTPKFKK